MPTRRRILSLEDPFTLLKALGKQRIPFVVVGGAALALHGIPRSTLDVDLVIPADPSVVPKLFSVARQLGLRCRQAGLLKIPNPAMWVGQWATFQDARRREWVDVLLEEPKVFTKLLRRSVRKRTGKFSFCVASLQAIEKMKRLSGRPIDLADIALIQQRRRQR